MTLTHSATAGTNRPAGTVKENFKDLTQMTPAKPAAKANDKEDSPFSTGENFAELLEESLKETGRFEGRVVTGTVISIDGDAALIDVGLKSEGRVSLKEFGSVEETADLKAGDTVDVFVEAAYFDPVRTAATGRKLRINSDARYRFERGVDPEFTPPGMELATRMILHLCGGEPSEVVIAGEVPDTTRSYPLDPERVVRLVGMEIGHDEQVRILTALGFEVDDPVEGLAAATALAMGAAPSMSGATLSVMPPSWRPDVQGEADLVEEIARVASLSKLEARPMARLRSGVSDRTLTPMQKRESVVRRQLASAGLNEIVSYSFVSETEAAMFGGGQPALKLENPISSEMSDMRQHGRASCRGRG